MKHWIFMLPLLVCFGCASIESIDPDETPRLPETRYGAQSREAEDFAVKGITLREFMQIVSPVTTPASSFIARKSVWDQPIFAEVKNMPFGAELFFEVLDQNGLCLCRHGDPLYRIMTKKMARSLAWEPLTAME